LASPGTLPAERAALPKRAIEDGSGDPRVYFAAERTLLAWVRTGIAIMAFGFVVARFGLFLRSLRTQAGVVPAPGVSAYLGTALLALGVIAMGAGAVQYRRFWQRLPLAERPAPRAHWLALALTWALVIIGALVGIALLR
jgi:putative membrane protein